MTTVAIDGPAGSGKSTVARRVAEALGVPMLDTGAMYRAVTWAVLQTGVDPADEDAVVAVAEGATLDVEDAAIRSPEVTAHVSAVSAHPGVRRLMVERQRRWVEEHGGGVVEGRDIGTVVLPDAPVKVFLTASAEVRALRRQQDEAGAERPVDAAAVQADLERRDHLDSTRAVAPLRAADDAVQIDTSSLTIEEVVGRILDVVQGQSGPAERGKQGV